MSPNTPSKQHHNLQVRPTHLIPMRSVENKDTGKTELRKDHSSPVIRSRNGTRYHLGLQGNIIKL